MIDKRRKEGVADVKNTRRDPKKTNSFYSAFPKNHRSRHYGLGTTERGTQLTMEDKERLEQQLHDMAVAVERLESSRQKLLFEIDSQSSEIERLFEENSNLSSAYREATDIVAHWEKQVKDCLKQNEVLRSMLDKLRTEQASVSIVNDRQSHKGILESNEEGASEISQAYTSEVVSLKGQLAKEQSRAETLSAEVLQLSAQLQQAMQAYNGLARLYGSLFILVTSLSQFDISTIFFSNYLYGHIMVDKCSYKPVLRNIESNLLRMKQDGSLIVQ
ncbi:hypothetical protein OSB04_023403 [Centaurea solstitialis]|uniref:Uncharacterized protein n=1 Tax=Centaurea solstitialis TaxID=347529 RepID=A0AA38WCW0_9ASTR|nr:hypothetical protein OSB04_023403 [Centaurea solstitialis]